MGNAVVLMKIGHKKRAAALKVSVVKTVRISVRICHSSEYLVGSMEAVSGGAARKIVPNQLVHDLACMMA